MSHDPLKKRKKKKGSNFFLEISFHLKDGVFKPMKPNFLLVLSSARGLGWGESSDAHSGRCWRAELLVLAAQGGLG